MRHPSELRILERDIQMLSAVLDIDIIVLVQYLGSSSLFGRPSVVLAGCVWPAGRR